MRRSSLVATLVAGLALGVAAGGAPSDARADEPTVEEKAGARAAAEQGNSAFKAGKYAEALDLFRRAETLVHAPTHVLMIARTHVALGQLVAAKEAFILVGRDALGAGAPAAFKKAQSEAKTELAALDPRIPTIHVSARGAAGKRVEISMDGKPVPDALVGIARPIDPGAHVLRATAEGMQPDERSLTVQEKDRLTVVLELKPGSAPAATAVGSPNTPSQDPPPSPTATESAPEPPPDKPGSTLRPVSIGVIGLGVVGLGVGTVFAILAKNKRAEADEAYDRCGAASSPDPCTDENGAPHVQSLDDAATAKSTIAAVSLIAGGVLTAGGIVLLVVSGSSSSSTARVSPWIGPGSAGVAGRF